VNRKQRRASRKQGNGQTPQLIGMRGGGPLPEANQYTLLALQNAFLALNSVAEVVRQEIEKRRPETYDAGSREQAYAIGRVHAFEECSNLLTEARSQIFLTHAYGAPRFEVKG